MKHSLIGFAFLYTISAGFLPSSEACTAFSIQSSESQKVFVGKNYDWYRYHGYGSAYLYPRGLSRTGYVQDGAPGNLAKWDSQFGSLTFTQFGIGLPQSGINEKGLVIEVLELDESRYSLPEENQEKGALNEAQWAQYQLDMFASVDEVLNNVDSLRIIKSFVGIHYFVTDTTGKSAIIEFLDGKPVVHTAKALTVSAVTNSTYRDLLEQNTPAQIQKEEQEIDLAQKEVGCYLGSACLLASRLSPYGFLTSRKRFQTLVGQLETLKETRTTLDEQTVFHLLSSVSLDGFAADSPNTLTQWSIAYNLTDGIIHFRSADSTLTFTMSEFNFNTLKQVRVLDLTTQVPSNNVTDPFQDYTVDWNTQLLRRNWDLFMLSGALYKMDLAIKHFSAEPWISKLRD